MPFTNRTNKGLLDTLFGKTSVFGALATAPTIHLAVSSTTPTAAGTNFTEPTTGSYARIATVAADWNTATDASPSILDNVNDEDFPAATADWDNSPVTNIGLFDALTAGNLLGFGLLSPSRDINSGDTLRIPAGGLDISLT